MLNDLLDIKYPIIQGGMANIATGKFAAAVSNAGALGVIATGGFSADEVREHIRETRELTDKPFGVNVMLMHREVAEIAKIIAEERVSVVTTGAGDPSPYVEMWKNAGIKVIPVVAASALAKRMERAGADAIIAEGTESGGHVGELTTMALVPQVIETVSLPVIAAGGIASGGQLLAAFALGAIGAQVGTILLASPECPIHENYKQAIIAAHDRGTTVTGRAAGAPVRALKNRMTQEYQRLEKDGTDKEALEELTLGALRRAVYDGDTKMGSMMAGQVAGQIKTIRPVSEILATLMAELEDAKKRVASL